MASEKVEKLVASLRVTQEDEEPEDEDEAGQDEEEHDGSCGDHDLDEDDWEEPAELPPGSDDEDPPDDQPKEVAAVEPKGPRGSGEHEIRPGECVDSVAYRTGHFPSKLWDHSANAKLKEAREGRNHLLPGDRLHVPPITLRTEHLPTNQVHRFRRKGIPAKLRIEVRRHGEPLAQQPWRLTGGSAEIAKGTTNGDGLVEASVMPHYRSLTLVVGTDDDQVVLNLEVGSLDPRSEVSGIQGRLKNLGYLERVSGKMDEATHKALLDFQRDQDLPLSGELCSDTMDALGSRHGF